MSSLDYLPDHLYLELVYQVGPSLLSVDRRALELFHATDDLEWRWLLDGRLRLPIRLDRLTEYTRRGYHYPPEYWFALYLVDHQLALDLIGVIELSAESVAAVGYVNPTDAEYLLRTITINYLRPARSTAVTMRTLVSAPTDYGGLSPTRAMVLGNPSFQVDSSLVIHWLVQAWQGLPFIDHRPEYRAGEVDRITRLVLAHVTRPLEVFRSALGEVSTWGPVPSQWRRYYRELAGDRLTLLDQLRLMDPAAHSDQVEEVITAHAQGARDVVMAMIKSPHDLAGLPVSVHRWYLSWLSSGERDLTPRDQVNLLNLIGHYDDQVGEEAVRVYLRRVRDSTIQPSATTVPMILPRTPRAVDRLVQVIGSDPDTWQQIIDWPRLIDYAGRQTRWYMYRHQVDLWFREFHEHQLPPTAGVGLSVGEAVLSGGIGRATDQVVYPPELGLVGALYRMASLGVVPEQVLTRPPRFSYGLSRSLATRLVGLPTTLVRRLLPTGTVADEARFRVVIGRFTDSVPSVVLESYLAPSEQDKLYQRP